MKNNITFSITIIIITVGLLTLTTDMAQAQTQPTSTITSISGKFYTPYQTSGGTDLTLKTAQVPIPTCSSSPSGDPDYYWDTGSDLDVTDNHDGVYGPNGTSGTAQTPDSATVSAGTVGSDSATVYCEESFVPSHNGIIYTADTETSVDTTVTVQVPYYALYNNGTDGSTSSVLIADYNFILNDQATSGGNPMENVDVKITETWGSIQAQYSDQDNDTFTPPTFTLSNGGGPAQAFPNSYSGLWTDDNGGWTDAISMTDTSLLDQFALFDLTKHPNNFYGEAYEKYLPYDHKYTKATYQGKDYPFTPVYDQKQSFTFTDTATPYLYGMVTIYTYSAENISGT